MSTGIYASRFDAFVRYKTSPSKPRGFATSPSRGGKSSITFQFNNTFVYCIMDTFANRIETAVDLKIGKP